MAVSPVTFIAEVSSNHAQDLQRCLRFIDVAAEIGCDAVKFQLFRVDELFAPQILSRSAAHRQRQQWQLPVAFLPELARHCREKRQQFLCSPFYLEAVDELAPFVDGYKIASYELLWHELLIACARTGKPVILSTGMATLAECLSAVAVLRHHGCEEITVLHCLSAYPAPVEQVNLAAIATLRQACRCRVGWSDHTVAAGVIHRAIHRWGAEVVEFHLDLDGDGAEYGTGHCWLPGPMAALIGDVRLAMNSDGCGDKVAAPSELKDRLWRADPEDGLRPLRSVRADFKGDMCDR